jgi:hypothetical protein
MRTKTSTEPQSVPSSRLQRLACCLLLAGGCASSQADEVRDARMERAEERADVQENSVERWEDSREDAIDQRYENKEERAEAGDRPGEDASKQLVEVSKERAQYQSEAKARVDKLGTRINTAQEKIQILGAQAPLTLKSELQTAAKQYDQIKEEVEQLDETPVSEWEHTTQKLEQREEGLDARVSKLEESIDDEAD